MSKLFRYSAVLLILVTFIVSNQFHLLDSTYWKSVLYNNYEGDYKKIRGENYSHIDLYEMERYFSEKDTLLIVSEFEIQSVGIRYFIYPIKIEYDSIVNNKFNYILSNDENQFINKDIYPYSLKIKPNNTIYSKSPFEKTNIISGSPPVIYFISLTILYIFVTFLIGKGFYLLFYNNENGKVKLRQAIAFPIGFVLINLATISYGILFNQNPTKTEYTIIIILLLIPSIIKFKSSFRPITKFKEFKNLFFNRNNYLENTFLLLIILGVSHIVFHMLIGPLVSGDAIAHWMFKSKILFHEGFDFSYAADKFNFHNEYPIFWSNYPAVLYTLCGYSFDQMAKWIQVFIILNYLILLYAICKQLSFNKTVSYLILFIATTLAFSNTMASTFAETIHMLFISFVFHLFIEFYQYGRLRYFLLICAFMGLVQTKIEGIPQGIIFIGCFFLSLKRTQLFNRRSIYVILTFLIPVGFYFIWMMYCKEFVTNQRIETLGAIAEPFTLNKFKTWLKLSIIDLSNAKTSFSMLMGIAFISVLLNKVINQTYIFTILCSIFLSLFALVAILSWNLEDIINMHNTNARLFMHAIPLILISIGYSLNSIPLKLK